MSAYSTPSPEAQLTFLVKLQRLFAEGDFTATYKFALLASLADISVEHGGDDNRELTLTIRQIGERFISLYWRQALPYGTGRPGASSGVLVQNLGQQAAVVSEIASFRAKSGVSTPQLARQLPEYQRLLAAVAATVSAQPVTYLQNFGGTTDAFLYERAGAGKIKLKEGVAYSLRKFYPLIQQLARSHWVGHIKSNRRNHDVLGEVDDLEEFLFETSRQSLLQLGTELRKLEGSKCHYCGHALSAADVDHFIPFSLYPRDLVHNFVLAHPACNRSKSDSLAASSHLEKWLERVDRLGDCLSEIGQEVGFVADATVSRKVASWAYMSALAGGGHAWVASNSFEPIDTRYSNYFSA